MRVINVSVSGCLVESHQSLDVGAVATLRVVLGGEEYTDDVQILRCLAHPGRVGPPPGCAVSGRCRNTLLPSAARARLMSATNNNPGPYDRVNDCRAVRTGGATCIEQLCAAGTNDDQGPVPTFGNSGAHMTLQPLHTVAFEPARKCQSD
jgi:hypothetical protein